MVFGRPGALAHVASLFNLALQGALSCMTKDLWLRDRLARVVRRKVCQLSVHARFGGAPTRIHGDIGQAQPPVAGDRTSLLPHYSIYPLRVDLLGAFFRFLPLLTDSFRSSNIFQARRTMPERKRCPDTAVLGQRCYKANNTTRDTVCQ